MGAAFFGSKVPGSFLPDEDQGYVFGGLQLPDASSLQRTSEAARQVEDIMMKTPGVQSVSSIIGYSLLSGVQTTYSAFFFVSFKPWDERKTPETSYDGIKLHLARALSQVNSGIAFAFPPPAILGVGTSGGFTFILEDRSGSGTDFLAKNTQTFIQAARKRPELSGIMTTALFGVPQVGVDVDKAKVLTQQIPLSNVYQTLQAFMGGALINYFNQFGLQWQVWVQADGAFRTSAENLGKFYVKNTAGDMVPLSTLTSTTPRSGAEFIMRQNLYQSVQINGNAAPGYSSGQAMAALEDVFKQTMPTQMGYDWSGMSYQQQKAAQGVSPTTIFSLSFLVVFLIMAAQYESWTLPFSVLLGVPIAVFGAFVALFFRHLDNDVYAQIGLVMLIGLSAKNAILIVEFAKMEYDKGATLIEASLTGAKLRLRPILMTAFAFILGCVPLWTATGAGGISRQVLGSVRDRRHVSGNHRLRFSSSRYRSTWSSALASGCREGRRNYRRVRRRLQPAPARKEPDMTKVKLSTVVVLLLSLSAMQAGPQLSASASGCARPVSRTWPPTTRNRAAGSSRPPKTSRR